MCISGSYVRYRENIKKHCKTGNLKWSELLFKSIPYNVLIWFVFKLWNMQREIPSEKQTSYKNYLSPSKLSDIFEKPLDRQTLSPFFHSFYLSLSPTYPLSALSDVDTLSVFSYILMCFGIPTQGIWKKIAKIIFSENFFLVHFIKLLIYVFIFI